MSGYLKTRLVPRGVGVGGALDVTELDLIGGAGRSHGHGKCGLEEFVLLVPVDLRLETQHARARIQEHALLQRRGAELSPESDRCAQWAVELDLLSLELDEVRSAFPVVNVHVPGVPLHGIVIVQLERLPRAPGVRTSRLASLSQIDVSSPCSSQSTRSRLFSIVRPATEIASSWDGAAASIVAHPHAGASTMASRPPASSTSRRACELTLNTTRFSPAPASFA